MSDAGDTIDGAQLVCAERVPGVSFDHLALHWRISAINRVIETEQAAVARQEGLTINTVHILLLLRLSGPLRPSDLSDQLYLTNAAITGCLDRLEEDALVSRTVSETDRRVRTVALTPAGERRADHLFQRCAKDVVSIRVFQEMPEATRTDLNDGLRSLLLQLRGRAADTA